MPSISTRLIWIATILAAGCIAIAAAGVAYNSRQQTEDVARAMTGGDPKRAPELLRRFGCAGCHTITGVPGGDGQVGGSLDGLRSRVYIGGVTTNSPDNLVKWIVAPQTFSQQTAMPRTGISENEARDVAAYLYAQ